VPAATRGGRCTLVSGFFILPEASLPPSLPLSTYLPVTVTVTVTPPRDYHLLRYTTTPSSLSHSFRVSRSKALDLMLGGGGWSQLWRPWFTVIEGLLWLSDHSVQAVMNSYFYRIIDANGGATNVDGSYAPVTLQPIFAAIAFSCSEPQTSWFRMNIVGMYQDSPTYQYLNSSGLHHYNLVSLELVDNYLHTGN
ncbi:hypothetical protein M8C21_000729, partial [Ambrosia artemisiifolia]